MAKAKRGAKRATSTPKAKVERIGGVRLDGRPRHPDAPAQAAPPQGPPLSTPSVLHGAGFLLMYGIANAPGGWMRSASLTAEQRVAAEGLLTQGMLEAYDAQDGRWYKLSPAGQHALWSAQSRQPQMGPRAQPVAQDCIGIHTHHDMGGDMVQRLHQHVAPQSAPQMPPTHGGSPVAEERLTYQQKKNLPDRAYALPHSRDLVLTDKYGRWDPKHVNDAAARLSMMWNMHTVSRDEYNAAVRKIRHVRHELGLPESSLTLREAPHTGPGPHIYDAATGQHLDGAPSADLIQRSRGAHVSAYLDQSGYWQYLDPAQAAYYSNQGSDIRTVYVMEHGARTVARQWGPPDYVPPGGFGGGRRQHPLNHSDIEQWIDNDEDLYNWWRGSGQSKQSFIRAHHAELVNAINQQLNRPPAGAPMHRSAPRPQHLSYADIEQWVDNDEGLYDWWRSSGQSKQDFIRANHAEIVTAIENVRSGSRPAHHLKYGRGQPAMLPAAGAARGVPFAEAAPQRSGVVRQFGGMFGAPKPKPPERPTFEQLAATFLSDIEEYEKSTWKDFVNDERLPKIVAGLTALNIKQGSIGPILGSGAFGTACAMDDGRVLKLTSDPTETQAAFVLTGKNLPHVVRMYGSWFVRGVRINAVVAIRGGGPFDFGPVKKTRRKWPMGINIVERVQPLSHDWEAARGLSMTVQDYKREHHLWPEQIARMGHERARQALKEASEGLEQTLRETSHDLTRSRHTADAKLATDVADALQETRAQGVYAIDVHGGNVGSVLLPGNAYGGSTNIPTENDVESMIMNMDDWLSGQPEIPAQELDMVVSHLTDARRDVRGGDWEEAGLDLHKARDAYGEHIRADEFGRRIEEIVTAIRQVSQSETARANVTYKIFDVGSSSPPPDPHAPTVPAPGKRTRKAGPEPEPDVHLGPEQLVFPGMLSEAPAVPWIGEGTDPLEVVPTPAPAVAATRKRKRA